MHSGVMLPSWLVEEISGVPAYDTFAGVEELEDGLAQIAASANGAATLRRVGTSRLGSAITCLTVGEGPEDAVVFGLPHPNEPVGGLTTLHLARRLCADPGLRRHLGHRWNIIACIDPDGLRLNQGWLRGPFTRSHYARHFYRPAGDEQIEWTFPVDHKQAYFDQVLPETLALMRLIDLTHPRLMGSLHNSEQGGAYYYVSRPAEALHPVLQELPESMGIPLDRGEPESPTSTMFAEGIFSALSLTDMYDAAEAEGNPLPLGSGETSDAYASRYGTFTLVSEVPYWTDPRVSDQTLTDTVYATALQDQADQVEQLGRVLTETLSAVEPDLFTDSPFLRASRFFGPAMRELPKATRRRATSPSAQRLASVAEVASTTDLVHSFRLRYGGMLVRLLDAEVAIGNVRPSLLAAREDMRAHQEQWHQLAEAADEVERLPIRALVATQYGALVASARHLHHGDVTT